MPHSAQLLADMERREGYVAKPYKDSEGFWTRGIGEHDGITENSAPVTHDEAVANLIDRLDKADADAHADIGPTYYAIDQVRREALIDVAYNTGGAGLASFTPMIGFIRKCDWHSAAYHLQVSSQGRIQKYERDVGARAVEIALRLATGEILPEQRIV